MDFFSLDNIPLTVLEHFEYFEPYEGNFYLKCIYIH